MSLLQRTAYARNVRLCFLYQLLTFFCISTLPTIFVSIIMVDTTDFVIVERTEKVSMGSIKNVLSEPIDSHPDYHVMV